LFLALHIRSDIIVDGTNIGDNVRGPRLSQKATGTQRPGIKPWPICQTDCLTTASVLLLL